MKLASRTTALVIASLALCACGMPRPDTPLTLAAAQGDLAAVQDLLAKGADPNERESHGLTPLVLAARLGRVDAAGALLRAGADPNRLDSVRTRPAWTPLMNAVHKGQSKVVAVLLKAGADVNVKSSDGVTALMLGTGEVGTDIVEMLLDAGADPRPGTHGSAALTNAVAGCQVSNVKALLAKAPDLTLESGVKGSAAVWLAKLRGHGDILRLIDEVKTNAPAGGPSRRS